MAARKERMSCTHVKPQARQVPAFIDVRDQRYQRTRNIDRGEAPAPKYEAMHAALLVHIVPHLFA